MISRRAFLVRFSALGSGLAWMGHAPFQALASDGGQRPLRLDRTTRAIFARLVGSTFRVFPANGAPEEMTLVEASALRSPNGRRLRARRARGQKAFSLVFQGSPGTDLPQETYRIAHERLGSFDLFLVPVDRPRIGARQYQAILA
jgi:hypothetical protein